MSPVAGAQKNARRGEQNRPGKYGHYEMDTTDRSSSEQAPLRRCRDVAGTTLHHLPSVYMTCGLAYLVYGPCVGIPARALASYSRTRRELLVRHGVTLRLRAIERQTSTRKAGEAWRRAVQRALARGRRYAA